MNLLSLVEWILCHPFESSLIGVFVAGNISTIVFYPWISREPVSPDNEMGAKVKSLESLLADGSIERITWGTIQIPGDTWSTSVILLFGVWGMLCIRGGSANVLLESRGKAPIKVGQPFEGLEEVRQLELCRRLCRIVMSGRNPLLMGFRTGETKLMGVEHVVRAHEIALAYAHSPRPSGALYAFH